MAKEHQGKEGSFSCLQLLHLYTLYNLIS